MTTYVFTTNYDRMILVTSNDRWSALIEAAKSLAFDEIVVKTEVM